MYRISDKKAIVYGTGAIAKFLLYEVKGLIIDFFVDLRGMEIESFWGYPVYSLSELSCMQIVYSDYVVILSIRNVFEHEDIAKNFFNIGFTNIIYKPKAILNGQGTENAKCIDNAYEKLITKRKLPEDNIISIVEEDFDFISNSYIVEEEDNYVTLFLKPELLFTNFLQDNIWSRVSFFSTYVLTDLYRAFEGEKKETFEKNVNSYIDNFALPATNVIGITTGEEWRRVTIGTRKKVYNEMNLKLAVDPLFFVRNCPTAQYLKDGRFTLVTSGKNRISFLIAKCQNMIPIRITKEDYRIFQNEERVIELKEILKKNKRYTLRFPIPHPYFYESSVEAEDYFYKWGMKVGKRLSDYLYTNTEAFDFHTIAICDCLDDWGSLGRYLRLMGCTITRINKEDIDIAEKIDSLFYLDSQIFYDSKNSFTAILVSSKNSLDVIDNYLSEIEVFCFVICENYDYSILKRIEQKNFYLESQLFISMWGNDIVEGFVYIRDKNK